MAPTKHRHRRRCCLPWIATAGWLLVRPTCPLEAALALSLQNGGERAGLRAKSRVAILIDGDKEGQSRWPGIVEAARSCGDVQHVLLFSAPGQNEDAAQRRAIQELGIWNVAVPRKTEGTGDPNDMAMALLATRLVSHDEVDHVAMAVRDEDFVYLARRLQDFGCTASLLLPRGGFASLEQLFAEAAVQTVWYGGGDVKLPTKKAVLLATGEGEVETITEGVAVLNSLSPDMSPVRETLRRLRYVQDDGDPIIPAFAKFAHVNRLGPFTVWPYSLASRGALELHSRCNPLECLPNPGSLAYVRPRVCTGASPREVQPYGSRACFQRTSAGGPFMVNEAEGVVRRVLTRLGFLSQPLNADLEEALEIFCNVNKRALAELLIPWRSIPTLEAREALLESALVSSKSGGEWRVPPKDGRIRRMLHQQGVLPSRGAPEVQVLEAMQSYIEQHGLRPQRSYNGCLHVILADANKNDPWRRS